MPIRFLAGGRAGASAIALLAIGLLFPGCTSGNASPSDIAEETTIVDVPSWPPIVGEPYPDLALIDSEGSPRRLSDYRGRILLIEPIGMSCPACQAFAGAHDVGAFRGVTPQPGLGSIEEYLRSHANIDPADPRLLIVQLLLYDMSARSAPRAEEARHWADHFSWKGDNRIVLAADPSMIGPESYAMIPGFQLVDRDFVLRVDSTGHLPRHDLWTELLPGLGRLVREAPAVPPSAKERRGEARQAAARTGAGRGQRLPDFELEDLAGERRSFDALRAGREALLYIYSGCCGHCTEQLPKVIDAARRFDERDAAIVGVEYYGNATSCDRNRKEFDLPGTILADKDGGVCGRLRVGDFTVFVIDADGVVRYRGAIDDLPSAGS